jgi:hypothetical protein
MKSLSSDIGLSISDMRRIVGKSKFDQLVDQAYRASGNNPEAGVSLVRERLFREHGVELRQEIESLSDER